MPNFGQKEKEPLLSQNMQDIINRSIDEKSDANVDDIFRYKYKIMKMLTSNQDILHTLHKDEFIQEDEELNGDLYKDVCIFDYLKLPDLKSDVRNFICFEVNQTGSYDSRINTRIIFRTVSHQDDCKTDWSISRQDLLAAIIKCDFDWTNALGMHLEKDGDTGGIADGGYYYREITYTVSSPNNILNKNRYRY